MQRTQDAGGACVNAGGSGRRWNFESVEHPRLSACPECNAALDHVSSYNKGMLRLISNHIHETMYVVHGYECANGHRVSSKIHTTIWASAYKRPTVPALMSPLQYGGQIPCADMVRDREVILTYTMLGKK